MRRLVERLRMHGIVELVEEKPQAIQGIFGVPKDLLARLILSAIPANLLCRDPPNPRLPRIERLAKLCVPRRHRLYVSTADLDNYYHTLLMPSALRVLFGLLPIQVGDKLVYSVDHVTNWVFVVSLFDTVGACHGAGAKS